MQASNDAKDINLTIRRAILMLLVISGATAYIITESGPYTIVKFLQSGIEVIHGSWGKALGVIT
jgi:hypothetical protein